MNNFLKINRENKNTNFRASKNLGLKALEVLNSNQVD